MFCARDQFAGSAASPQGLAGCRIGRRRLQIIRWAADRHIVLPQVAHGRSGINQFALLVANRTHDQLERIGLLLRECFGNQGVRLERALRGILDEAVGDAVHLVTLLQDRGVDRLEFRGRNVAVEQRLCIFQSPQRCADGIEPGRSGNDSVVVARKARRFDEAHLAAIGAAIEVRAPDRFRAVVIFDELFRGERHIMDGAEEVVDDFRHVGRARRGVFPRRVGYEVARVRNRGGVASREEHSLVGGIRRSGERTCQAADSAEDKFLVPVGRKHDLEICGAGFGAVSGSGDGTLHVAILGVGLGRRHDRRGRNRHAGNAKGAEGRCAAVCSQRRNICKCGAEQRCESKLQNE